MLESHRDTPFQSSWWDFSSKHASFGSWTVSHYNPAVGCTKEEEGLTVNSGADQIPTVHATSALFHLLCGCTPLPCTLVSHSGLLLRPVPLGSGERRFPAGLSASGCLLCSLSEPFRLGGSWNAWRRRLGVSMLWQSFGLTGLDWRYFLRHSHLSTWTQ